MEQLIPHLVGDYIFQSSWMADNKAKSSRACACHCFAYVFAFCLFGLTGAFELSPTRLCLLFWSHFFIDRFRLARWLILCKNVWLSPDGSDYTSVEYYESKTGNPKTLPEYLAIFLFIVTDNTLHLICNFLILR